MDKQKYYTKYWVDIIKMRYSTEVKYRKFVKVYDFLSFARSFSGKYGRN